MIRATSGLSLVLVFIAACGSKTTEGERSGGEKPLSPSSSAAPAEARAGAEVAASASAPPESSGPVVAIPAGKLVAGTACGDHPRLPSEELSGTPVEMSAFDIDAYPYPNDPTAPARTSVSQEQAAGLCKARGRRLCTELEWERACKGPMNTRYEYGDRFDVKKCSKTQGTTANGGPVGALDGCVSPFGVHAMHGFVFERTASGWERGVDPSSVVARGGFGNQPFAHLRCAAAKQIEKETIDVALGFRCCGGAENAAKVTLERDPRPAIEPVEPLDEALTARVLSALKNGHLKTDDGGDYTVEKAWKWHPVGHEELVLARVAGTSDAGAKGLLAVVVELCERTVQLSNRAKSPVDELGDPTAKDERPSGAPASDPSRHLVLFPFTRGGTTGQIRLEYQFGQAVVTETP